MKIVLRIILGSAMWYGVMAFTVWDIFWIANAGKWNALNRFSLLLALLACWLLSFLVNPKMWRD